MSSPAEKPARLPPVAPVSVRIVCISGIVIDIYGVDELSPDVQTVSVLWLHHGRTRTRRDMTGIATRTVRAVADSEELRQNHRGVIAAAFDQRNHGPRLASERANGSWQDGNERHAQDMFGMITGTAVDTRLLMDLLAAHAEDIFGPRPHDQPFPTIVQHMVLGISLGGHCGWHLLFGDERVTDGVLVIGCPDYMTLMEDRARLTERPSYKASQAPGGQPFLGSRDFPPALVDAVLKNDPRGILFGKEKPTWLDVLEAERAAELETHLRGQLQKRIAGKRFLLCSGTVDNIVPYAAGDNFYKVFKKAAQTWPDLGITVHDHIYKDIGHAFSPVMIQDAVSFLKESIATHVKGQREHASSTYLISGYPDPLRATL